MLPSGCSPVLSAAAATPGTAATRGSSSSKNATRRAASGYRCGGSGTRIVSIRRAENRDPRAASRRTSESAGSNPTSSISDSATSATTSALRSTAWRDGRTALRLALPHRVRQIASRAVCSAGARPQMHARQRRDGQRERQHRRVERDLRFVGNRVGRARA